MSRLKNTALICFIVVFIVGFEEIVRNYMKSANNKKCPYSKTIESHYNLRFFVQNMIYIVAGRLTECNGEFRLTEAFSEKGAVGSQVTFFFVQSMPFYQLQHRDGDRVCVLMITLAQTKELAIPKSTVCYKDTVHYWTNLVKFEPISMECPNINPHSNERIIRAIKRFFMMDNYTLEEDV